MLDRLFGAIDANRRFAADASHELRSPITSMLGEVGLALKRERTAEEYRDVLMTVQGQLREMTTLTDNLMLLVRAQEGGRGTVTEIGLAGMLADIVRSEATACVQRDVVVTLDIPSDLVVYGDVRLLERAIDNVVRNAVQFSPAGDSVSVSARLEPQAGDWVSDTVVLRIADHGPGIPDSERQRIFERFYRIDSSRSRRTGGAGLGLAIARNIVQLFGGTIGVVETAGPGATVEIRLPGARTGEPH
jgi:signal transduction histidine kinase